MCAYKNVFSFIIYSNSNLSDLEILFNSDTQNGFTKIFGGKSINSKRGFIFDIKEEYLGLTSVVRRFITRHRWKNFYKHPLNYNTQWMKELYSNLINTNKKTRIVFAGKGSAIL